MCGTPADMGRGGFRMQTQRSPRPQEGLADSSTPKGPSGLEGDPVVSELKKLYNGIVDEPVPDQLMELLRKLDEVERNR